MDSHSTQNIYNFELDSKVSVVQISHVFLSNAKQVDINASPIQYAATSSQTTDVNPQQPSVSFSLAQSSTLPPLPSPTYSPSPQLSPRFPSSTSLLPQNQPIYPFSPYSPYGSHSHSSSSTTLLPFNFDDDFEHRVPSPKHGRNSISSLTTERGELSERQKYRLRKSRNSRLIGIICCVTMVLIALAIFLAVFGVTMKWGEGKDCVKWEDGRMTGKCQSG